MLVLVVEVLPLLAHLLLQVGDNADDVEAIPVVEVFEGKEVHDFVLKEQPNPAVPQLQVEVPHQDLARPEANLVLPVVLLQGWRRRHLPGQLVACSFPATHPDAQQLAVEKDVPGQHFALVVGAVGERVGQGDVDEAGAGWGRGYVECGSSQRRMLSVCCMKDSR